MSGIADAEAEGPRLKGPETVAALQRFRQLENWRNLVYLGAVWAYLAVVIGGTVAFDLWRAEAGLGWWWSVPVFALGILLVGAGQHNLTGLAHEASHHTLVSHRVLNDLLSDWFCMFPMLSSTHHYRLQHLAHHQFVNDPDRDPDVSQLRTSGHWLTFPLSKRQFVSFLVQQLWLPNLIRYIRIRALYNSMGTDKNPYLKKDWKPTKILVRVGLLYMLTLVASLTALVWNGWTMALAIVPAVLWAGMMLFYAVAPQRWYHQSRVHSAYSGRVMTLMRVTFLTAVFVALAWVTHATGVWAAVYFLLLWIVPMFTSFSLFMILRQLVQHGNADRGWLTNTRTFFVHPFIRWAVFPMGQDFHLPHHMFASVPHYRLRELHEYLLTCPEYRVEAAIVEGYFLPKHRPPQHPTVLDVMAAGAEGRVEHEVFTDDSVLDDVVVDEKERILAESRS